MAGVWLDFLGTTYNKFKLGLTGPTLKDSSGKLNVRNSADNADAEVVASKVSVSGELIELNSDAALAGADWKVTLQRPTAGMTASIVLTLPIDDGTAGQVLSTDGAGVLSFISAGNTALADKVDTTSLAFGTASPAAMFSTGATDVITKQQVIIDTAFNGTPSLSIGIAGSTSKYMASTQVDLTAAAGTIFEVNPGLAAQGAEALIATYAAGGASVGAARLLTFYASPA